MIAKRTNRVQAMLDDETFAALKQAAHAERRTVSDFVRVLIEKKLGTEEK